MIDMGRSRTASSTVHMVPTDPGPVWTKDRRIALDAPPDEDTNPRPEAIWPTHAVRTGLSGVVAPRVIRLPDGTYRMFYTQILPQPGHPGGANDYDHSMARILSAHSTDGENWQPEPGVRLGPVDAGNDILRVVSSEVVPTADANTLRMYFECSAGPQSESNSIRSALSTDEGLTWRLEEGDRLAKRGCNYSAPRIVFLDNGQSRLYCYERGLGIISAIAGMDGLEFQPEPGVRIAQDGPYDRCFAFAPEIVCTPGTRRYIMYYAGYREPNRAFILRATSSDGLNWIKEPQPAISPGPAGWDAAKSSEMCIIRLPTPPGSPPRYRMFYEACDGTAQGERGVWRIASATTT